MLEKNEFFKDYYVDRVFDGCGLKCPLPVLKARRYLSEMLPAQKLLIITTDPGAPADFKSFVEMTEHILLAQEIDETGQASILIEKA